MPLAALRFMSKRGGNCVWRASCNNLGRVGIRNREGRTTSETVQFEKSACQKMKMSISDTMLSTSVSWELSMHAVQATENCWCKRQGTQRPAQEQRWSTHTQRGGNGHKSVVGPTERLVSEAMTECGWFP